jgi:hypothetical protein
MFQPKCPIFSKKQQRAVVFMFFNEKLRFSKFKMAAARHLILRKFSKILTKMAAVTSAVGSKIILKMPINA